MRTIELNWYELEITWKEDWDARDVKHWTQAKYSICTMNHWTNIVEIDDEYSWKTKEFCDGQIGTKGSCFLGVYTGDCCNIAFLWKNYFGVVHGSWKTLYQWIVFDMLKKLEEKKENLSDLVIFFGPSIRKDVYEVGREFYNYFPKKFLQKIDWILTFDMVEFVISQLERKWVERNNIVVDEFCSYQNNDIYFSHRKWEAWRNCLWVSAKK